MIKKVLLGFFSFFTIYIFPWTWSVVIENKTTNPKAKLSIVDEYLYPFPRNKHSFIRAQAIAFDYLPLPVQNLTPPPLARRIVIWAQKPGAGAALRTNQVIIAPADYVTPEEREKNFIFHSIPSGHYQIHWDNNYNLVATREYDYKSAVDLFKKTLPTTSQRNTPQPVPVGKPPR